MDGIYHFNSRGYCKELEKDQNCSNRTIYKFICRYDNCNKYDSYDSPDEWNSELPDCKIWDTWPEYNIDRDKWPQQYIPLRQNCDNRNRDREKLPPECNQAINQKFKCKSNQSEPIIGNFCSK